MLPCIEHEYPAQTSRKNGEEREEETARKAVLNVGCTVNSTSCDGSWVDRWGRGEEKREQGEGRLK
jgi:hypothetical protein